MAFPRNQALTVRAVHKFAVFPQKNASGQLAFSCGSGYSAHVLDPLERIPDMSVVTTQSVFSHGKIFLLASLPAPEGSVDLSHPFPPVPAAKHGKPKLSGHFLPPQGFSFFSTLDPKESSSGMTW